MPQFIVALMIFALLSCTPTAQGQTPQTNATSSEPPAIEDNSFLIEEAFNQEEGVIQHISTFSRQRDGNWLYTFTEEIPVNTQRHQFSFTIPVQRLSRIDAGSSSEEIGGGGGIALPPTPSNMLNQRTSVARGLGDVALNYRYQLFGMDGGKLLVAPRVSLLLPTGRYQKGLGIGAAGIQLNLPISIDHSRRFITHYNAGATLTPKAANPIGERATTTGYNLGQSTIWKAAPILHVMFETVWNSYQEVTGQNLKERRNDLLINPGVRWAHNFRSGLQIVPGVAVPLGVGPSRGERGVFLYISFEHPVERK